MQAQKIKQHILGIYVNLTNYPLTYMINYEKITPTVHVAANKTVLLSCPKNG